jgi:CHASE3 domain sensor protein
MKDRIALARYRQQKLRAQATLIGHAQAERSAAQFRQFAREWEAKNMARVTLVKSNGLAPTPRPAIALVQGPAVRRRCSRKT